EKLGFAPQLSEPICEFTRHLENGFVLADCNEFLSDLFDMFWIGNDAGAINKPLVFVAVLDQIDLRLNGGLLFFGNFGEAMLKRFELGFLLIVPLLADEV